MTDFAGNPQETSQPEMAAYDTRRAELMESIVTRIAEASDRLPSEQLSGRCAQEGAAYSGEMMWVGRAVNGWGKRGWSPTDLRDEEEAKAFIKGSLGRPATQHDEGKCDLRWVVDLWSDEVGDYNSARSAFWRCAKAIMQGLPIDREAWSSALVWSNLYKIAPKGGGNPTERLAKIQEEPCRDLLLEEVKAFRPKRLVLATGRNWAKPFLNLPCFAVGETPSTTYVHRSGSLIVDGDRVGSFVVADHPQGKDESKWVREVQSCLERQQRL